jgi:hypothetical protein
MFCEWFIHDVRYALPESSIMIYNNWCDAFHFFPPKGSYRMISQSTGCALKACWPFERFTM